MKNKKLMVLRRCLNQTYRHRREGPEGRGVGSCQINVSNSRRKNMEEETLENLDLSSACVAGVAILLYDGNSK